MVLQWSRVSRFSKERVVEVETSPKDRISAPAPVLVRRGFLLRPAVTSL